MSEGWVEKESRHFGAWRARYLILHELENELCTYTEAELLAVNRPVPTERIALLGAVYSAGDARAR